MDENEAADEIVRRFIGWSPGLERRLNQTRKGEIVALIQMAAFNATAPLKIEIERRTEILDDLLLILDPAPDGKQSRCSAKLTPCLLYGGIAKKVKLALRVANQTTKSPYSHLQRPGRLAGLDTP